MEVDGTEKVRENASRGSKLPISGGIQAEAAAGPLGETVVAKGHPASTVHQLLCQRRTYSPELADKALPSGLTF